MMPVVPTIAAQVDAVSADQRQEFADEPLVPGSPTLAMVKTMNSRAYLGMLSARPP